jgi:hypothetical protein
MSVLAKEQDGGHGDEDGAHSTDDSVHEERQRFHRRRVGHQESHQQKVMTLHQRNDPIRCNIKRIIKYFKEETYINKSQQFI